MDRIPAVLAIASFFGSPSLAASESLAYDEFWHPPASYQETGFDRAKPTAPMAGYDWLSGDDRLTDEGSVVERKSMNAWLDRGSGNPGAGIGVGVVPLFDAYGVYRTRSNHKKPAYIALGYISDELILDDAALADSVDDSGFSIGFGVKDSSFSFEYMMSVDEADYDVSTIGMGFISKF